MPDTMEGQIWEGSGADRLIQVLPDGFGLADGIPETDAVMRTLSGEAVLSRLYEAFLGGSSGAVHLTGQLCGVLVLCAVWKKYRVSVRGDDDDLFSYCVTLVLCLIGFRALMQLFSETAAYFSSIHTAVTAALTTLTVLGAMRGAVTTATVTGMGMAMFLSVMEAVTSGVLFPFLRVCTGLSLASSVGGGEGLSQISGLLRRQFLWLIGALMMLLCAVLSYQTVLARASDSVALRTVKFTLSGAIPIIGGAVGEAASAVAAGVSLTSKTVGVLGVAAVLWQILPTLCAVYLTRLAFSVSAGAASFLGMPREEAVLGECASLVGFLLAVCIVSAVLYILMITLCMNGGG